MKTYRIVTDVYNGYEVQRKINLLFFSIWVECNGTNSWRTVEEAERWIRDGVPRPGKSKVVKIIEV